MVTFAAASTPQQSLKSFQALHTKCQTKNANLVLPRSLSKRTLCIVGEALGADEDFQGDYFVGKAGKLLDKLLSDLGLKRDAIHITNIVKVRPPDNKLERLHELGLKIEDFIPYLIEELSIVQPMAILALGTTAMEWLTVEKGITKWRGSTLPCTLYPKATVIPTLHPAYLQRGQMDQYPYVRNDVRRFGQVGFGLYKTETPYISVINPTLTEAVEFLSNILEYSTETCFDIETVANQRITCIGWTTDENSAICIPFRHNGLKLRWSEAEQIMLINLMQQIFAKPGLLKIGQNLHYDVEFLLPLLGFPREPLLDTRFAHMLIHPDAPHDLGFITSVYTNMNYHKDDMQDWSMRNLPHDETLWEYNIKDVIATHRSANKIKADLKELNLYDFFVGYIMPFRRVVFEMEHRGIKVDMQLRNAWRDFIIEEELPVAQQILNKLAGQELNPNSSKQVGTFLTTKYNLPVPKTKLGNYTVKEEVLEQLRARYPRHRDILEQILCTRVLKAKDLGTYLSAVVSDDGYMRSNYSYTVTGRLTSSSKLNGEGANVQNIPDYLRQIFIPEDGQVFLEPDLSQAEARVMAWLMHSDKLKAVFKSGQKIHKIVGGWIYGKSPDTLTPFEYLTAKRTVHGSNYDMGERKFSTITQLPVAEARRIRERYFTVVPELPAYHAAIRQAIEQTRKLTTFYGRTRVFTGRLDDETYRSGYAQIPQSTVVDTINIGILALWLIKPDDVHVITQTHDSVLLSIHPDKIDWFKPYIKIHLETLREMTIGGDLLTIPVDIGESKVNWYGK